MMQLLQAWQQEVESDPTKCFRLCTDLTEYELFFDGEQWILSVEKGYEQYPTMLEGLLAILLHEGYVTTR